MADDDNVIRPQFGRPKQSEKEKQPPTPLMPAAEAKRKARHAAWLKSVPEDQQASLQKDLTYAEADWERVSRMVGKMNEMIEFFFALQGFQYRAADVQLRRGAMKIPLEELCNQMDSDQCNRLNWSKRPSTYYALMKEFRERITLLLPALPE